MKVQSFVEFAHEYVRFMTSKNVSVTFSGDTAYTDMNRVINLPALPSGTALRPSQVLVFGGFLDHEIGHFRFTEKRYYDGIQKNSLLKNLLNLFDDIQLENQTIADLPGQKKGLDAVTDYLERNADEPSHDQEMEGIAEAMRAIYVHSYKVHRDSKVTYNPYKSLEDLDLLQVEEVMKDLRKARSTKEALKIAKEVEQLLLQKFPEAKNYTKSPEPGKEGQEMKGKLLQLLKDLSENWERGDALEEMVGYLSEEGEEETSRKKIKTNDINSSSWYSFPGNKDLPPLDPSRDRIFSQMEGNLARYQSIANARSSSILELRRMLQRHLRSKQRKAWERGLEEGTLDTDALPGLQMGDVRLFKALRGKTAVNHAFQFMIDASGSMDQEVTIEAAIMLTEALEGIKGVKLSVASFTTGVSSGGYTPGFGRKVNLVIQMMKDWKQDLRAARASIGGYRTTGYTPIGEAFSHGRIRLLNRKERKRVLVVLTDGEPHYPVSDREHSDFATIRKAYNLMKKDGIEVIVMGIGSVREELFKEYADYTLRASEEELPKGVLTLTKKLMGV